MLHSLIWPSLQPQSYTLTGRQELGVQFVAVEQTGANYLTCGKLERHPAQLCS